MQLTEEQILALAPDESSRKSGRDLAAPAKWVTKGRTARALWGECQGSGSKPYQTCVDLQSLAFKCSCPSRKFPCKHGVGLLLHQTRYAADVTEAPEPAWVSEWLDKRSEREEKKTDTAAKPVDEAAQAKRRQAREDAVSDGIAELLLWVKDIIRNGILLLPEKESDFFGNMARRMVDAKAAGLAGMVRELGEINYYGEGWQTEAMDGLIRIYLVISGFTNSAGLPEALRQDVRQAIGFTVQQEALKELPAVPDVWLVLGMQASETDGLTTERYWLYGVATQQYALVLQFIARGQTGQLLLTPGLFLEAELVFFPSAAPLRAIITRQTGTPAPQSCDAFRSWSEVAQQETEWNSRLPFRRERPYILEGLRPVRHNDRWWLQDAAQQLMPVKKDYPHIWKLLSLSGGAGLTLSVLGTEGAYEPMGAWYNGAYTIL